jgi:uncharacterized protein
MDVIKLTYKEIEDACFSIFEKANKEFVPDVIVGVTVGGLFPAVHFARLFNTKNLLTIGVKSYEGKERKELQVINLLSKESLKDKKVLLVDDILDSGKTFEFIKELFIKEYSVKEIKTVTVYVNEKNCAFYPDYYFKTVDKWVFFPWDRFEKE